MAKSLRPRRGSSAQHAVFVGDAGELTVDTSRHSVVVHDGVTPGGFDLKRELILGSARIGTTTASEVSKVVALQNTHDNDWTADGALLIWCGDSTTEQMRAVGFDWMTSVHRISGQKLESILGVINFGGSGQKLDLFLNAPAVTPPTIPTDINAGISAWDYYGHKPSGAISLATALNWRVGKAETVIWTVCFGINDCILDASVGNLSQSDITDYIVTRLIKVVETIWLANPQDKIVLRIPNPMTARPYNPAAGFPSATQYPTFGANETNDRILVEKWNQALYSAYYKVRQNKPNVRLLDTWKEVFGVSNTTLLAGSQLSYLSDLVHPSNAGYARVVDAFVNVVTVSEPPSESRRKEAELRATTLGGDAWDHYDDYLTQNPAYSLKMTIPRLLGGGPSHIDLEVSQAVFYNGVDTTAPIWVKCGKVVQRFTQYTAAANVTVTRLIDIVPTTALQAARGNVEVYQQVINQPSTDLFILTTLRSTRPRIYFPVKLISGGNGYFDIRLDPVLNRPSTKFLGGLTGGQLVIGGGVDTIVSLATVQLLRHGTTSQRVIRALATGDFAAYAGKEAFITFSDEVSDPTAYEYLPPIQACGAHTSGCRLFINCPIQMVDGGVFSLRLTEQIPSPISMNIYRLRYNTRTQIGTITIPANADKATMLVGNPTSINAFDVYEAELVSATTQTTGVIVFILNPT